MKDLNIIAKLKKPYHEVTTCSKVCPLHSEEPHHSTEPCLLQGVDARERKVVWNRNDNRVKFICLNKKATRVDHTIPPSPGTRVAVGEGPGTNANGATVIAISGKDAAASGV